MMSTVAKCFGELWAGFPGGVSSFDATSRVKSFHRMDILPPKEGYGGGGGIRTHGGFNTSPVFKTGAINRSTTPPF